MFLLSFPIYVHFFVQGEEFKVNPVSARITLVKKDADAKSINDSLMSRLRPMYRGSASALVALAGAENGASKKEEGSHLLKKIYQI